MVRTSLCIWRRQAHDALVAKKYFIRVHELTNLFSSEGWSSVYSDVGLALGFAFFVVAEPVGGEEAAEETSVSSYAKAGCFCSSSSLLVMRDDDVSMVAWATTA